MLLKFEGEAVVDFPSVEGDDLHEEEVGLHAGVEVAVHEGEEGLPPEEEDLEVVAPEGEVDHPCA